MEEESSQKYDHIFYFYKYTKGRPTWMINCTELYIMEIHSRIENQIFSQKLKPRNSIKRDPDKLPAHIIEHLGRESYLYKYFFPLSLSLN